MPLREHHLGHVTLCPHNRILKETEQRRLTKNRLAQLMDFCPKLNLLSSCDLVTGIEATSDRLLLHYFLHERDQPFNLFFDDVANPKIARRDSFTQDILNAVDAVKAVRGQIALAMNPNLHANISEPVLNARELNRMRRAIWKHRGRQLELPGLNDDLIAIPLPPRTIPVGTEIAITALITRFSRGEVRLDDIRVVEGDREVVSLELSDEISMTRAVNGPQATYNALLMRAQDHRIRIKLNVVILRQWSDTEPLLLRLVIAHEYQEPPPTNLEESA